MDQGHHPMTRLEPRRSLEAKANAPADLNVADVHRVFRALEVEVGTCPAEAQQKSAGDPDNQQPLPLHPGARLTARVALALGLVAAALWTAADFLPALVWAGLLAVAIWPLYEFFDSEEQIDESTRRASPKHR